MKAWENKANRIMTQMGISEGKRRSILYYADTFAPNMSNEAKCNRALHKAREV